MAGEFKHVSVGTSMTQAEFEAITGHAFNSQATGDILYASSGTQLSRLAKGTQGYPLIMGASIPQWGGAITLNGTMTLGGQTLDAGAVDLNVATTGVYSGISMVSTQDGTSGVRFEGKQVSASPAPNDSILFLLASGKDSGGSDQAYSRITFKIQSPTAGSELGKIVFQTLEMVVANDWVDALELDAYGKGTFAQGIQFAQNAYTASGAIIDNGLVALNQAGSSLVMTLANPGSAGKHLVITQIDADTQGHTVTGATAGAFDGTNEIATFNEQFETLVLVSVSSTRWVIVENIGAVGLST